MGYIKFQKMDIAGRKFVEQTNLLGDQRCGAVEVPEGDRFNFMGNKTFRFAFSPRYKTIRGTGIY